MASLQKSGNGHKELATLAASSPPAYLDEVMKTDAGKGLSTDASDNLVPLAAVLQKGSPQVDETSPSYVPGAKAGDILLKNLDKPVVKGQDGFLFQPCHFSKDWVEWVPRERGGGLVARHRSKPKEASEPSPDGKTFMPNGNELKETRYHEGYAHVDGRQVPFVVNFTSTGHTVSRNWMFSMNTKQDAGGRAYPAASQLWRLKTRERSNAKGKWFVIEPFFEGYVSAADYARGEALRRAFESGEKEAEAPVQEHAAADDGTM